MSNLSRRTIVASAAALPALAVPAVASFNPDHPDAELLRLGVRLEAAGRHRDALEVRIDRSIAEHKAACVRAGIPTKLEWPEAAAQGMSEKEWWDHHDKQMTARNAIPYSRDWVAVCDEHDAVMDQVNLLADEILDLTATTVDGLRVQARALDWTLPDWPRLGSDEYGEKLIHAVFGFVGVTPRDYGSGAVVEKDEAENL
jgi:hypothetical protein